MESFGTTVEFNQYPVYLGSWVNWSRGRVFGATLTMTTETGNLLIAFTALFVAFISSRFWRIACLLLHRRFSSPHVRDALHHQRQAVLRNSSSPEVGFWSFGLLLIAWRASARRPIARLLPILLGAFFCACGFAIAGGFSSQISAAVGREVLIDSSACGLYLMHNSTLRSTYASYTKYSSVTRANAGTYAQQCYSFENSSSSASTLSDCNLFAVDRIPAVIDNDAPCPFNETICRSKSNIQLDTGYLNSHEHFGVNAPPDERILFRNVFTCAPLETKGYTQHRTAVYHNFTSYYYGPSWNFKGEQSNYTYESTSIETQYPTISETDQYDLASSGAFDIWVAYLSSTNNSGYLIYSDFEPRPELFRPDTELILTFFRGEGLQYAQSSTDDWYRATVPSKRLFTNGDESQTLFRPDEAAAPLGCISQYQFCTADSVPPDNRTCGPLADMIGAAVGAAQLFGLSEEDFPYVSANNTNHLARIFPWLWLTLNDKGGPMRNVMGQGSLPSRQTMYSGVQYASPKDQWKRDVTHWWYTYLASLQTSFADAAGGVRDPDLAAGLLAPEYDEEVKMCRNQKIRSRRHTSFSIFGISVIYGVGALLAIVSYVLEPIFNRLDRRGANMGEKRTTTPPTEDNYGKYTKDVEWTTNDVLHLQCLSFQARQGCSNFPDRASDLAHRRHPKDIPRWTKFQDVVPVTEPGDCVLEPLMFAYCDGNDDDDDATRVLTTSSNTDDQKADTKHRVTESAFSIDPKEDNLNRRDHDKEASSPTTTLTL